MVSSLQSKHCFSHPLLTVSLPAATYALINARSNFLEGHRDVAACPRCSGKLHVRLRLTPLKDVTEDFSVTPVGLKRVCEKFLWWKPWLSKIGFFTWDSLWIHKREQEDTRWLRGSIHCGVLGPSSGYNWCHMTGDYFFFYFFFLSWKSKICESRSHTSFYRKERAKL